MTSSDEPLHILITGAAGFIGQELASAFLSASSSTDPVAGNVASLTLTDVQKPPIPATSASSGEHVKSIAADLTGAALANTDLFTPDINAIYILHGLMSSTSEANLDTSTRVNIDSIRNILDLLRHQRPKNAQRPPVKVIFASSTAVYGPPVDTNDVITERTAPEPRSTYGAHKHIAETLISDISRRGFIDARIVRLPTVLVRPGTPTGAASSFASGIFREPLKGEKSILPVKRDVQLWICSPHTVVQNLIHAVGLPASHFEGASRIVNLPGQTVSVQEMLDALKAVGGDDALQLVEEKRDAAIEKIVEGWPFRLDTRKALQLGFCEDVALQETIVAYMKTYGITGPTGFDKL